MTPVSVTYRASARAQPLNVLSFNDFHGAIDPPTGSGGLVNGVPAGGAEYLATTLEELRAQARVERVPSVTLGAGDLVGATPLVSAAFHDEPAIEALNLAGLDVSSVGNHEFDEGTAELLRIQNGGCHLVDGCQDGDGFAGARFRYGEAFTVQPFNNLVVTQTFTGAQLKAVLEQQFVGFQGQTTQRILQVSAGFTYSYDATAAAGERVSALALGGVAIDPAASYRVTTNDFLANGGDGFTTLTAGTTRVTAPGFDVDALTAYLGGPAAPVPPGPQDRITRTG